MYIHKANNLLTENDRSDLFYNLLCSYLVCNVNALNMYIDMMT